MIPVPAQTFGQGPVRVWLAAGQTDMRRYVEPAVMQSL